MENIKIPVYTTTGFMIFYLFCILFKLPYPLIMTTFLWLNFLIVWMVIRVLKDGKASTKTFEESWYEDGPQRAGALPE